MILLSVPCQGCGRLVEINSAHDRGWVRDVVPPQLFHVPAQVTLLSAVHLREGAFENKLLKWGNRLESLEVVPLCDNVNH